MTTGIESRDNRLSDIFVWSARGSAIIVAIVGALTIAARIGGTELFEFGTGGMGVCFVLAGAALFALLDRRLKRFSHAVGYLLALLVSVLAFLNIGRYFFDLEMVNSFANLSIGDFEMARLITMTPADCIGMFLIGCSLLMLHLTIFKIRPSEILTFSATLIAVMALLGVLLKIDTFCLFFVCTRISQVGALTFALLCLATLFARPQQGLVSLMCSPNAGGVMARRLIPSALGIPILLSWARMEAQTAGVSDEISMTAMISAMVILFSLLLWWNAWSLDQMDAARQKATQRLAQSEKRTRMVIQQAIDAFIAIDCEGIIKDWNDRAEFTFGWNRDEMLGQNILSSTVPERMRDGAAQKLKLMSADAQSVPTKPLESIAQHKDGHEFPVEISFFPVNVDSDLMLCGFVRDISERKEVEQRFKEFYSTVSHELRSPLSSLRLSMNIIQEIAGESLPEIAVKMLETADISLDRLIRLINDLLDVKRIEDGHLNLKIQPLDPITVAKLAIEGLKGMALPNEIELQLVVDDASTISADADRIVQVLTNMVSNAIKFSPAKAVVTVRLLKSRNPMRLRFAVEDQGPGIPPADLHKLFSKFGQLAEGRKKLGTGLGLAISKAIIEEHSGEIGIDSTVGKGSTFWCELPLSKDSPAKQMATLQIPQTQL